MDSTDFQRIWRAVATRLGFSCIVAVTATIFMAGHCLAVVSDRYSVSGTRFRTALHFAEKAPAPVQVEQANKLLSGPARGLLRGLGFLRGDQLDSIGVLVVLRSHVLEVPGVTDEEIRVVADQLASANPDPRHLSQALQRSGTYWTIDWSPGAWRGVVFLIALYSLIAAAIWGPIFLAVRGIRTRRRRRRVLAGQCLACGYPRSDAPKCPECGELIDETLREQRSE
ncbi:MAG: hypothetical protein K2X32_11830 [Phycisphaerales bacterium]|nr:hypothetical protein [Phycisphaerales bacterium]